MRDLWRLLNGPSEIATSRGAWAVMAVAFAAVMLYPLVGSMFMASNMVLFALYVPIALGLSLLWGYCGVLSFGQMAFFGVAGYVYGILATNLQAVPGGTLIAAFAGLAATALFAAFFNYFVFYGQVSAWIIPVLTLVLTLVAETFMGQTAGYQWKVGEALLGGYNGMTNIPSLAVGPWRFGSGTLALYYLVMIVCVLVYLAMRVLVNSRWGATIVAIREDEQRTRMVGHNVNLIQVLVAVLAAVLSGLSGIFYVSWGNYIDPSAMGLISATLPVVWVCVGGRESLLAVLLATVLLGFIADLLSVYGGQYAFLVNGALLLGVMLFYPSGIFVSLARAISGRGGRTAGAAPEAAPAAVPARPARRVGEPPVLLSTTHLCKSFGGVSAISDLSFTVREGELRCLIGPNGAGKSTFFSLLTGIHRPDSGEVVLKGERITGLPSFRRVRLGLSLKFQTTRTYQNLSVAENLQIPRMAVAGERGGGERLAWALETFGLSQSMGRLVKDLSHEHQQWLEICLALATDPDLLLLDEPTTGMTPQETSRTAEFVTALNRTGMAILVVEHDMAFVRQLASPITILHHGSIFAEGSLAEIESNMEVRRIYLGE